MPAAERLMASEQPSRVLAAALAAMSGFRKPPRPRSLLTYDEGIVTLRLLEAKAPSLGKIDGWNSLIKVHHQHPHLDPLPYPLCLCPLPAVDCFLLCFPSSNGILSVKRKQSLLL